MKRFILFFGFSILVLSIQAQVGINTEDPKAVLDIEAINSINPALRDFTAFSLINFMNFMNLQTYLLYG